LYDAVVPTTAASTSQGRRTRERILAAATKLFAERGFAPVTIRAIGEAAGIDNSSLYRHFESKDALARAAIQRSVAELAHAVGPSVSPVPPTLDGLVAAASAVAMALWERPETARLLLHLLLGWRDEPTGFRLSIPMDDADDPTGALFRSFAAAHAAAVRSGRVRGAALPDVFVPLFAALVLRPATRGSFLLSQEPDRSGDEARAAWRAEIEHLVRASLAP
jgi:AcrR family transcriptional regulator